VCVSRKGSDQLAGYSFVTYTDVQTAEHVIAQGTLSLNGQELKLASAVRKVRHQLFSALSSLTFVFKHFPIFI
jgi:hypothetical protein